MQNEYLELYLDLAGGKPLDRYSWIDTGLGDIEEQVKRESKMIMARHGLVTEYAWAVPSDHALNVLACVAPLVEIGAGGGYWAALLRARGVDVVAYDARPGGPSPTERNPNDGRIRVWSEVLEGGPEKAAEHPDRTLFLCWPPYDTDMAHDTLAAYLDAGGAALAYVGEGWGGCNATDEFFELLEQRMTEVQDVSIPQWPGIHDYLTIYRTEVKR